MGQIFSLGKSSVIRSPSKSVTAKHAKNPLRNTEIVCSNVNLKTSSYYGQDADYTGLSSSDHLVVVPSVSRINQAFDSSCKTSKLTSKDKNNNFEVRSTTLMNQQYNVPIKRKNLGQVARKRNSSKSVYSEPTVQSEPARRRYQHKHHRRRSAKSIAESHHNQNFGYDICNVEEFLSDVKNGPVENLILN